MARFFGGTVIFNKIETVIISFMMSFLWFVIVSLYLIKQVKAKLYD